METAQNRRYFLPLLLFSVVLSRLPLLFGGFGTDGDAWRIALTAQTLWNDGIYEVSRFPGYPLYELLLTPVIALGGSLASNAATLLVFLGSILLLRRILQQWSTPHQELTLVIYAFLPLLWKNSAVTMEYIWGLTLLLGACLSLLRDRSLLAGILLGLAAGTRPTHIVFVLPLLLLIPAPHRKTGALFAGTSVAVMAFCFLPALLSPSYGIMASEFLSRTTERWTVTSIAAFVYRLIFSVGPLGLAVLGYFILRYRMKLQQLFTSRPFLFSTAMVFTTVLLFILLPDEREYLIPALPFLLIASAYFLARKEFIFAGAMMLSFAFVTPDVLEHTPGRRVYAPTVNAGIVLQEYRERSALRERIQALAAIPLPDSSIVMVGMGPQFWMQVPHLVRDAALSAQLQQETVRSIHGTERYFIYALKRKEMEEFRRKGYRLYYWDVMGGFLNTFIGYDLADERVEPIGMQLR
jgi:hypothetical protein